MDVEERLKEIAVGVLEAVVESGVSPRIVGKFTGINYRKIYRFLGGKFYRPTIEECKKLEWFIKLAGEIRQNWINIILSWDKDYHKAVLVILYRSEAARILQSKETNEEKATRLMIMTLRQWAEEKSCK